jgi:hypothetical protein
MNFTKLQLAVAGVAAVATSFISFVPDRNNIYVFLLLALLTIRPLLTLNKKLKIISAVLLVYFLGMGAEQYWRGKEYQQYGHKTYGEDHGQSQKGNSAKQATSRKNAQPGVVADSHACISAL